MPKVAVRRMKRTDAAAVRKIDTAITSKPSEFDFERLMEEEVKRTDDASFVAVIGGKVVGYMVSYITSGNFGADRCAWIARFGVEPKCMGQNIGRNMAKAVFKFYNARGIKTVYTTVKWDSTDLLSFFKALGFDRSDFINLRKGLE